MLLRIVNISNGIVGIRYLLLVAEREQRRGPDSDGNDVLTRTK